MMTQAVGAPTFSERVVERTSAVLAGRDITRRGFLFRVAVVASALTVQPFRYLLRPVSAYDTVCGAAASCGAGWSAFCCTIHDGRNTCPPGSYVAGWWKVDDSAFCRGGARYYIDCNRLPQASCRCRCAEGPCDHRRVCCNNFRYGQCNQQIPGTTEVVCRVVTCTTPWDWDPACSRTVRVEPATATHSATCLPRPWPSHIEMHYLDLGLAGSLLGRQTGPERDAARGGRSATYERGLILWSVAHGAITVLEPIADRYQQLRRESGPLGYPTAVEAPGQAGWHQQPFERGVILRRGSETSALWDPLHATWRQLGGVTGRLGAPTSTQVLTGRGRGHMATFERGAIYVSSSTGAVPVTDRVLDRYRLTGGPSGPLGFPTSAWSRLEDRRGGLQRFEQGVIWHTRTTGAHAVTEPFATALADLGGPRTSGLGYPTAEVTTTPTGTRWQDFEHGALLEDRSGAVTAVRHREPRDARHLAPGTRPDASRPPRELPPR